MVLLLSCNALANNTVLFLPSMRVSINCWVNPLLAISTLVAGIPLTLKSIRSATASQLKLTVELRVVLTDWGLTIISEPVKYN